MKNCLHIYTGDGKGKTTAAVGLTVRFLAHGSAVLFLQFMKGAPSGEITVLEKLGVPVLRLSKNYGFYPNFSDIDAVQEEHNRMLSAAEKFIKGGGGLLVLDESLSAYTLSLVSGNRFLKLLQSKSCEIICTGRNAPAEITDLADYITEMRSVRHPFEKGILARPGIEF